MSDERKRTGAAASGFWTEARRKAHADMWDAERTLEEALRRKAKPQGNRSKQWWAEHPEARLAQAARMRRRSSVTPEEFFAMADRVRELLGRMNR